MSGLEFTFDLDNQKNGLLEATVIATPGLRIDDNTVILTLPKIYAHLAYRVIGRIGNIVSNMLERKPYEYLQSVALSTILEQIIGKHQIVLTSWGDDSAHNVDANLFCGGRNYKIDFTLDESKLGAKINDRNPDNKSDWVVHLSAPGNQEFHRFVFEGYSGDYTEKSLKDFLKNHPDDRIKSVLWKIIDRSTKQMPSLIQKNLSTKVDTSIEKKD